MSSTLTTAGAVFREFLGYIMVNEVRWRHCKLPDDCGLSADDHGFGRTRAVHPLSCGNRQQWVGRRPSASPWRTARLRRFRIFPPSPQNGKVRPLSVTFDPASRQRVSPRPRTGYYWGQVTTWGQKVSSPGPSEVPRLWRPREPRLPRCSVDWPIRWQV
jgi:hypothetical protein